MKCKLMEFMFEEVVFNVSEKGKEERPNNKPQQVDLRMNEMAVVMLKPI